jgi:hypothetical protein
LNYSVDFNYIIIIQTLLFEVKDANRYAEVKRAQGVSTTNLLKRILSRADGSGDSNNPMDNNSPYSGQNFIATTNRTFEFAYPIKYPKVLSSLINY